MRFVVALLAMGCATAEVPAVEGHMAPPEPALRQADLLATTDASLRQAETLTLRFPADWGRWATVADLRLSRARLSGRLDDYAEAQAALDVAFDLAPNGSGPHLAQARLDLSLHRLDAAAESLVRAEARLLLDENTRSEHLRMRGDLALQRGQLDEAAARFRASSDLHPTLPAEVGLTQVAWQRGAHNEALDGFDRAEAYVVGPEPATRMWLDLQRGLVELSREHYDDALGHYQAAAAHVDGHWLVDEHIAEVTLLLGDEAAALEMYQRIVLDTHNPEFMDAIAGLLMERGDERSAAPFVTWADATYARNLAAFPEASAGHALDHYLSFGDAHRALELAEKNAALRPNGEALTALSEAYRAVDRLNEAERAMARAFATGHRSVDAYREAAAISAARGDHAREALALAEVAALVR